MAEGRSSAEQNLLCHTATGGEKARGNYKTKSARSQGKTFPTICQRLSTGQKVSAERNQRHDWRIQGSNEKQQQIRGGDNLTRKV